MEVQEYKIDTEFIKLQQVIKAANLVSQGSDAKELILSGEVKLNNKGFITRVFMAFCLIKFKCYRRNFLIK